MPDKDQAVLIRAIAYSGRPDWRELLTKYKDRMPLRQPLIDVLPRQASGQAADGGRRSATGLPWSIRCGAITSPPASMSRWCASCRRLRWSKNKNDGNFSLKKIFSNWRNDPSAVDKISTGATRQMDARLLRRAQSRPAQRSTAPNMSISRRKSPSPCSDVIVAAEAFEIGEDPQGPVRRHRGCAEAAGDKRSRHVRRPRPQAPSPSPPAAWRRARSGKSILPCLASSAARCTPAR